jgi:hypothetical protein
MKRIVMVLVFLSMAVPVAAQTTALIPPVAKTVSLSGPRFGVTFLDDGVIEKLAERNIEVRSSISQFGWQFEKQFYSKEGGVTAVNEWVFLLGGLDQSVAIPSLSWMVGLRTRDGAEFGIGPNVTPGGVALALAGGFTLRAGLLNVPVNMAIVPSKVGTRISVLTGFNMRGRR